MSVAGYESEPETGWVLPVLCYCNILHLYRHGFCGILFYFYQALCITFTSEDSSHERADTTLVTHQLWQRPDWQQAGFCFWMCLVRSQNKTTFLKPFQHPLFLTSTFLIRHCWENYDFTVLIWTDPLWDLFTIPGTVKWMQINFWQLKISVNL